MFVILKPKMYPYFVEFIGATPEQGKRLKELFEQLFVKQDIHFWYQHIINTIKFSKLDISDLLAEMEATRRASDKDKQTAHGIYHYFNHLALKSVQSQT